MGLLLEGKPLSWEELKKIQEQVRELGIRQFINLYKKLKNRPDDELKWGDEIEYTIIKFDDEKEIAKAHLNSHNLISKLNEKEHNDPNGIDCLWRLEYSSYQLESTPAKPYGKFLSDFGNVEKNMRLRREEALKIFGPNECLMTITTFPRLGCLNSCEPSVKPTPHSGYHASLFLPDEAICSGNRRWQVVTQNILHRRGETCSINLPIYRDENVPRPFKENLMLLGDDGTRQKKALDDHIFMDTLQFGMGSCCLQVTLQAKNIKEAFVLYDQLTAFCPIMVALTAAAPLYRGYLTDVDSRWVAVRDSCDDRTRGELGLEPLKPGERIKHSGRNGLVEWYLSDEGQRCNDIPIEYDEKWLNLLLENDVQKPLAEHIAHLFYRDCILLLPNSSDLDEESDTNYFESLQGTTWRIMRFKPPPPNSDIGWRVEFRPMDIQFTDFENAASVCFVILLSRIILKYNLNFLIPLSKIDENMMRSQKRDAINREKLWFRKNVINTGTKSQSLMKIDDEYGEFTIDEIINGKKDVFIGILPLMKSYLDDMKVDANTLSLIQRFMTFFEARAKGHLLTDAAWIRKQVLNHKEYKKDAVITEKINYDLLKSIKEIGLGLRDCPEVIGPNNYRH